MNGYRFFRLIQGLIVLALVVVAAFVFLVHYLWHELKLESAFRQLYGDNWQTEYEKSLGPLSNTHARMIIAGIGLVAIPAAAIWLIRVLRGKNHDSATKKIDRKRHRTSPAERRARRLRNAVLGIYF